MFEKLKKAILGKPQKSQVAEFSHPDLGDLKLNDEIDCWEVTVTAHGDTFKFGIVGDEAPNQALVQHAVDILRDYPAFKQMLSEFLLEELKLFTEFEDEIEKLTVDQVYLCWPDRPENGMIYFNGPDKFRCWRCDYKERKPKTLGFDD